jgi:hypothetical protein
MARRSPAFAEDKFRGGGDDCDFHSFGGSKTYGDSKWQVR